MGTKISDTFDLELTTIPLWDLHKEFHAYYDLLAQPEFRKKFHGGVEPIEIPNMVWRGAPGDLLTLMLLRAILGIESFLPGIAMFELGGRGLLTEENIEHTQNPYLLKGSGTVVNYYHRLPRLINEECSLKVSDTQLWDMNITFYREVRNPINHGHHVGSSCADGVLKAYDHISKLYDWIDGWRTIGVMGTISFSLLDFFKTDHSNHNDS